MKAEMNVLFVVIDALRAKNIGCYGYAKNTSPYIDKFANDALLFENAYSCAVFTDPSLTTVFSGMYPCSHGITTHGERVSVEDIQSFKDSGIPLLPQILKENGYTTLAIDWLGRWHKSGYDYYSGILNPKKLHFFSSAKLLGLNRLYIRAIHPKLIEDAKVVTDRATSLLEKVKNRKFFLFVHYWDTHIPYNPPPEYTKRFASLDYENNQGMKEVFSQFDSDHLAYMKNRVMGKPKTAKEVLVKYDGAISYVDHHLSRLIKTLEDYGIYEKTLIVLTADHGESLTEHGIYFGHHGLYETTIHVPLILKSPNYSNGRIKGLVQHIDIVPTILDMLEVETDLMFDGASLTPTVDNERMGTRNAVYVEENDTEHKRAVRTVDYKYIYALSEKDAECIACGRIHGGTKELYDLTVDPEETSNIAKEKPEEVNRQKKLVAAILEECFKGKRQPSRMVKEKEFHELMSPQEKEELKKRLRNLGYI